MTARSHTTVTARFLACAGASFDDACFIAQRYEPSARSAEAADPRRVEWILGHLRDGAIDALWATRGALTGMVRNADGDVFVSASRSAESGALDQRDCVLRVSCDDAIHVEPAVTTRAPLDGLTTLADGTIVGWSMGGAAVGPLVVQARGVWFELPAPEMRVHTLHGSGLGDLFAASDDGRVARWDGRAWGVTDVPLGVLVTTLLSTSATETWAATFMPDRLLRWDGAAWHVWNADHTNEPIEALARCGGRLYAAFAGGRLAHLVGRGFSAGTGIGATSLQPMSDRLCALSAGYLEEVRISGEGWATVVRSVNERALVEAIGARRPLWETAMLDVDPRAWVRSCPTGGTASLTPTFYGFAACVGASLDDAVFLASRRADREGRFDAERSDAVLGHVADGVIRAVTTTRVELCGLSRAPSGTAWVAAFTTEGLWRVDPRGPLTWEALPVPHPRGVFALDDRCVIAWGGLADAQSFWRYDGRDVRPMPAPPMHVLAVHGCAPDMIVAVGRRGAVARWNGEAWLVSALPTAGALASVWVVSPDEAYATGPCGMLFEGSRHGWAELAPVEGVAASVVKFRSEVLVGGAAFGLHTLRRGVLVAAPLSVFPWGMHASEDALLLCEDDGFVETRDLKRTRRIGVDALVEALRFHRPSWR